jgi:N-acylneuraminate cytidylyltransferase/CMP-N,N'-diacetyllegionaminic acid synthase
VINGKSVLCVIPARGGSKGVSRKNLRELNGRPLLGWPIRAAKKSKYIDEIICSTEDLEIAALARELGANTPFQRPLELASDQAATADVLLHAIDHFEKNNQFFDYLLLLEPTSPLTETVDIDTAIEILESEGNSFDSLVTVCESVSGHPNFTFEFVNSSKMIKSINQETWKLFRRQEINPLYFVEGTLYLSKISTFKTHKLFIQPKTFGMEIPRWKSFEIDDELDFLLINAIMCDLADAFPKEN